MKSIFHKNTCNYNYKIIRRQKTLYIKNVVEKINFQFKKGEVTFLHSYNIINHFLIINYKNNINIFYLYKYYINK